ncbi:MAG: HAD-IA family hydrolase [Candidatus Coatesbacteria bacterium]|nr:MAG: HAD-IA family hydrolase [Candidatus Coatesbacteria bacterium]
MIRAVIFDLDNTLTDFMKMKERAIEAAAEAMIDAGLPRTKDEIIAGIHDVYEEEGIEYQKVFDRYLIRAHGKLEPRIHAAAVVAYRRAREGTLSLYPHVHATLLELLRRGIKLGVLSDAPRLQAWLRLAYLQLHNLFDAVVTYEDTMARKPDPEPFRKILEELAVAPQEALMVGDWPGRDVEGARALGIRTVYARYGDTSGEACGETDYAIDDVAEVIRIVDELHAESRPES